MQIIDLTYPLHEGMTSFNAPWHPPFEMHQLARIGHEGRETRKIVFGSHTGTHLDAPLHFVPGGGTVDALDLNVLVGPVSILDFSHLPENTAVTPEMIPAHKVSTRMIFRFGWSRYWGTKKFYTDYPFFPAATAHFLVERGVKLVGMDSPSPDDARITCTYAELGSDKDSPAHKVFLPARVILVEYLTNLDQVTDPDGWTLAALPLKLKGCDGAPSRVILFR